MPTTQDSPPKRMTRARAKAVEETKKAPAKSTKIVTPAAKAAAASRTTKRKTRTEDEEEHADGQPNRSPPPPQSKPTAPAVKPATNTSMRGTKTAISASQAGATSTASKTTRGRPKKITNESSAAKETSEAVEAGPPARSTRTRAGSVRSTAPPVKSVAAKKKVSFQEADSDKENVNTDRRVRSIGGAAGAPKAKHEAKQPIAGAKSVRRTNINSTATNSVQKNQGKAHGNGQRVEPLSPRKNAQISVPAPASDNDQDQATTPVKELSKSPKKAPLGSVHRTPTASAPVFAGSMEADDQHKGEDLNGPVDELQGSTAIFTSPTKTVAPSLMTSPPKRPGQSPFKGAMMESARRAANKVGHDVSDEIHDKTQNSIISKPPKRFPMTEPRKKAAIDDSNGHGLAMSLFGTPAKRPVSPSKGQLLGSTIKAPATTSMMRATSSGIQGTPRRLLFSPNKTYTSSLKAIKSPEASAKVHKMTLEEQTKMLEDELVCGPSPFSPSKESQPLANSSEKPVALHRGSKVFEKSVSETTPKSQHSIGPIQAPVGDINIVQSPSLVEETVQSAQNQTQASHASPTGDEDIGSEDELQSCETGSIITPFHHQEQVVQDSSAPKTPKTCSISPPEPTESMTVLAERFGAWKGATPDGHVLEQRKTEKSMFTPLHPIVDGLENIPWSPDDSYLGIDLSYLGDETVQFGGDIPVHTDEDVLMLDSEMPNVFRQSQISDASQEYGDENALPIDPSLLEAAKAPVATCTPARVFGGRPQVVHTVCKVPLKPSDDYDETPMAKPARRTHSLSASLSPMASFEVEALRQIYPSASSPAATSYAATALVDSTFSEQPYDEDAPNAAVYHSVSTPNAKAGTWSAAVTPARTPRPDLNTKLLSGAVIFVDVHTTEGADASGIFVELLTQMGARCVRQWNWNSRASHSAESVTGDLGGSESTKIGITHVVFKDGGKRTMEKVREARGLVLCVGVGWVLDCERENKWLDEAEYAIDTSTIPRGGQRRRKSMEPKALSNATFTPAKQPQQDQLSPTKEFLNLSSSPAQRRATISSPEVGDRRVSFAPLPQQVESSAPATPVQDAGQRAFVEVETPRDFNTYADSMLGSPATPYFLHPEELQQKTCPPKQSQQLFFPVTGRIEDEADERMKQRLIMARRKSLQFAPRVGSPLSRAHSFQ